MSKYFLALAILSTVGTTVVFAQQNQSAAKAAEELQFALQRSGQNVTGVTIKSPNAFTFNCHISCSPKGCHVSC